jgi:RNA polymerase sigma-70 factor (ECF subfamily)
MDLDIERIFREESGRIVATLIRLLGSFDLAEEAMQEAFTVALEQWPEQGIAANPRAWLISTAHHKALDILRRNARFDSKRDELTKIAELEQQLAGMNAEDQMQRGLSDENGNAEAFGDDRLRLIFTCCHPALALEAQVALTLRTLCGLTTDEIARAFLLPVPTLAQRLVRAKQKIRDARIPYQIPPPEEITVRLEAVLLVIYLVFNEGYNANSGANLVRRDLCLEAIRLARVVSQLLPHQAEVRALLALMLLHDSRSAARADASGDIVLLEEQDRSLWNRNQIEEGLRLVESALRQRPVGPYAIQAAIAAIHGRAARPEETDWRQIEALYELLVQVQPTPVVQLNHAAAVAMSQGPAAGLRLLEALESNEELNNYYLLHAARADLLRRLEQWRTAAVAYKRSLELVTNEAERSFLLLRLAEIEKRD